VIELSDLEEAGSALLPGDECGTGVDVLAFDDAEAFDVGADVADVNVDDDVEDAFSPTVAASVNRFVASLQQLGFPQHQLFSPHFLTGAFSPCHYSPSVPSTTVQHRLLHSPYYSYIHSPSTPHSATSDPYTHFATIISRLHSFHRKLRSFDTGRCFHIHHRRRLFGPRLDGWCRSRTNRVQGR